MFVYIVSRTFRLCSPMNTQNHHERQLREELKWAREAHAISEMEESVSYRNIIEARKDCIVPQHRHMVDWSSEDLEKHITRLETDLEHAQQGEF